MGSVFELEEQTHNLRTSTTFRRYNIKTVQYGTESIGFLAPKSVGSRSYRNKRSQNHLLNSKQRSKCGNTTNVDVVYVKIM